MVFVDSGAFQKIDVVNDKDNRRLFIFFLTVAFCGYASIITSGSLYNDDYVRYVTNHSTCYHNGRFGNVILEYIMFLSNIVLDAAPFTHIVSCAILSFTALVCLRMFCKTADRCAILFAATIVVNPYLSENMLFRFDNLFMTLALLCSILAAYVSLSNDRRNLVMQILLLFSSLTLYQSALSAYFVVLSCVLIEKISSGEKMLSMIKSTKYWWYTAICTAALYSPIVYNIKYTKLGEKIFVGNCLSEYLEFVFNKICRYFGTVYLSWSCTHVGVIVSIFILGFIAHFFVVCWKNKLNYRDYVVRSVFLSILIFAFFLSPIGILVFFNHAGVEFRIPPRMLYSISIATFVVLHKASIFFEKKLILGAIRNFFSIIFLVWNVAFMNICGNLMKQKYELRNAISYSIANELCSIQKENISKVIVATCGNTNFFANAVEEYPFLKMILENGWQSPIFSSILIRHNGNFYPLVIKSSETDLPKDLVEIVDRLWYTLYFSGKDTLVIKVKGSVC